MELVALRGSMLKSQDQLNTDLISLTVMTGQRRVDPSAAIFIRQRQNQTGNGQWAITGISEAEQT